MVNDVDAYIAASAKAAQPRLRELRRIIRGCAPKATEGISYRMPLYKHHGMLVAFCAHQNHVGLYVLSGTFLKAFKKDLARYETSAGTVRFPLDKPVPAALVKKLVRAKVKENESGKR